MRVPIRVPSTDISEARSDSTNCREKGNNLYIEHNKSCYENCRLLGHDVTQRVCKIC